MSEKMSERLQITARITSAVLTLAQIVAAAYLIAIDRSEHVPTIFLVVALAAGSAGTAALPSLLAKPRSSSSSKPPRRPPPAGPATGLFFMLALLLAIAIPGCVSATDVGRGILDRTSAASARIDHELAASRRRVSAEIIARADATREEHRRAMRPYDAALDVTLDLRESMLATENAIDAVDAGREGDYMGLAACVLASFAELVSIAARRVDVPDDAGDVLLALGGLARGACPLPDDDDDAGRRTALGDASHLEDGDASRAPAAATDLGGVR